MWEPAKAGSGARRTNAHGLHRAAMYVAATYSPSASFHIFAFIAEVSADERFASSDAKAPPAERIRKL